jgi:hypothetical protein
MIGIPLCLDLWHLHGILPDPVIEFLNVHEYSRKGRRGEELFLTVT